MSRPLRVDPPEGRHHVMNRGARQAPVFLTDQDHAAFLELLGRAAGLFALRVHGYALMGDHYHLLLSAPRGNLAEAMGFLQSRFSRRQSEAHGWDGPLFRGRYKNRLVEDDAYWRHLLAYVHLQPVQAHLVDRPEDAAWTSHRAYLGLEPPPAWLHTSEYLALFGGVKALVQYLQGVQSGREGGPASFDPERLWARAPSLKATPEPASTTNRGVEQAMAEVCAVTGRSLAEVERAVRGPGGNPARLLAIWWLREGAGLGTNAIARRMHMNPAAVSRDLRRAWAEEEGDFGRWKARLRGEGRAAR